MEWTLEQSAKGFLALAVLTWVVMFGIFIVGLFLKRRILLWDEKWREKVEQGGMSLKEWAQNVENIVSRIRVTTRLLGFFLFFLLLLMGGLLYWGTSPNSLIGVVHVANGLWLLTWITLAVLLPVFVCFAVGTHLSETMLLRANDFLQLDEKQEVREKKARLRGIELAKKLKAQRDAQQQQAKTQGPAKAQPAG